MNQKKFSYWITIGVLISVTATCTPKSVRGNVYVSGFPLLYCEVSPAQTALGGSTYLSGNHPELMFHNPGAVFSQTETKLSLFAFSNDQAKFTRGSSTLTLCSQINFPQLNGFIVSFGYRSNAITGAEWINEHNIPTMSGKENQMNSQLATIQASKMFPKPLKLLPGRISFGFNFTRGRNDFNVQRSAKSLISDFNYGFMYDSRPVNRKEENGNEVFIGFGVNHHYEAPSNYVGKDLSQFRFGTYIGCSFAGNLYSYLTTEILDSYKTLDREYGIGIEFGWQFFNKESKYCSFGVRSGHRSYRAEFYSSIDSKDIDIYSNQRIGVFFTGCFSWFTVGFDWAYVLNTHYSPIDNFPSRNDQRLYSFTIGFVN